MARLPFISLDGLDGTGKSTQCRLLATWLREHGWAVTECTDPGGTALGAELRHLLVSYRGAMAVPCEALLFMASRAQLVAEVIQPALLAGCAVLSDRFTLANVVYQGHAGGVEPAALWTVGRLASSGLEPDLTLVLDLAVEESAARRQRSADRVESRGYDYHARVRAGFLLEAQRQPERMRVVDGRGSVDEVQQRLRGEVARQFPALLPSL